MSAPLPIHGRHRSESPFWDADCPGSWVRGWGRPFESKVSLQAKYCWLNRFARSSYSFRWTKGAEERFLSEVPPDLRIPDIRGWKFLEMEAAICPSCLASGYHSELPQMLGLEHCPFHHQKLVRLCSTCSRPLHFGNPRFGESGPFICRYCSCAIVKFEPGVWLTWANLNWIDLIDAFGPLHIEVNAMDSELDWPWSYSGRLQTEDCRAIFKSLTGRNTSYDIVDEATRYGICVERTVMVNTFRRGVESNDEQKRAKDIREISYQEVCRIFFKEQNPNSKFICRSQLSQHGLLRYYMDDPPLKVFEYLRGTLPKCISKNYRYLMGYFSESELILQAQLSDWKIATQLVRIRAISQQVIEKLTANKFQWEEDLDALTHLLFPFLQLRAVRLEDRYLEWGTAIDAWLTPIFICDKNKSLNVYQIKTKPLAS